jgi:hypothetical protein
MGGGVYSGIPGGSLLNNILALNTGIGPDVSGNFASMGHNLIGITNGSIGFTAPEDRTGSSVLPLDPKVAPLADNGGPTLTMALLPDSPAIDAGTATGAPATDQRGIVRPQGLATDIGAYEFQYIIPRIVGACFRAASSFQLQFWGLPYETWTLQTSTNLLNWSNVTNLCSGANGMSVFVDSRAGFKKQLYR